MAATNAGGGRRRARERGRVAPDHQGSAGPRSRAAARAELVAALSPVLSAHGFDLEDVGVTRAGSRSVVRVVVDRDGGVDLDAVAQASRVVSDVLDSRDASPDPLVAGTYVLEVSSPGVDRPLVEPRHWRRAAGRLVSVTTRDGRQLLGRVGACGPESAEMHLAPAGAAAASVTAAGATTVRISFADVVRAAVQVEFRAPDDDPASDEKIATGEDAELDAEAGR